MLKGEDSMALELFDMRGAEDTARHLIAEKLKAVFPRGCKKILLIEPQQVPEEDYDIKVALDKRYPVYPPTGLAILSRVLARRGYFVDLLELNFLFQNELQKKGDAFDYTLWRALVRERLEAFQPELVGITCMFTITHRQVVRIANFVKEACPNIPIIAGGVHTSMATSLVFKDCPAIDFIGLYEANDSFPDLVDFINGKGDEEKLTQIATMMRGEYVAIDARAPKTQSSVDIIPDYHDLPIGDYSPEHGRIGTYYWLLPEGAKAATVLSNIGCRAQCTFCSVREFNGLGVVSRSVKSVVDEIQFLKETYGISHIMWLDDDLLYDPKRTLNLFNEMVRRNVNITWDASNGIIASALREETAHAMYESGCIGVSIGVESGNAQLLRSVKKPSTVKQFYRCSEILRKYPRIFTKFLLMVGFPGETIGMVLETVKLAKECGPDWSTIQPLNFIPGVELTNHAVQSGILTEREIIDGTERPFVGSTGGQARREKTEQKRALEFENPFSWNPDYIPSRDQIKDVWMVMDWKINYENKIWHEKNPVKLEMLRKLFINICDKTHHTNAMGNLYFALIEFRLGNVDEAKKRIQLAKMFAGESAYWNARFRALGLYNHLDAIEKNIADYELSKTHIH